MFKRAIVRLLLFGVPFAVGFLASRPAPATETKPTFVICAYPDGEMRVSAEAAACAAGSTVLVPAGRTLDLPAEAENSSDPTVHLPF